MNAINKHTEALAAVRMNAIKAMLADGTQKTFREARQAFDKTGAGRALACARQHERIALLNSNNPAWVDRAQTMDGRVTDCDECGGDHENGTLMFARGYTGRVCLVLTGCPREGNGTYDQVRTWAEGEPNGWLDY